MYSLTESAVVRCCQAGDCATSLVLKFCICESKWQLLFLRSATQGSIHRDLIKKNEL